MRPTVWRLLLLLLSATLSSAEHIGKSTGAEEQLCTCGPPSAPPEEAIEPEEEEEEEEAAEDEAEDEAEEDETEEDDKRRSCPRRDVQKIFISGAAGAMLATAIAGRRTKRDNQTWTTMRDSSAQTYEEPRAPAPPLPPVVQYLPPPPPRPARPPPPELVYELTQPPPTRTAGNQTRAMAVESSGQTDWLGAPPKVTMGVQTASGADTFAMGVQTLGIPHSDGFAQAVPRTRECGVQWEPQKETAVAGAKPGYHLLLADDGAGGKSSSSSSKPATSGDAGGSSASASASGGSASGRSVLSLDKFIQTDPQGVQNLGVQTDSLYTRATEVQTAAPNAPITFATQTDRAGW